MNLFLCLDENNGMMFNERRQSRDKVLNEKVLNIVGNQRLFVLPYSQKLFNEAENITVSENPLDDGDQGDFCFFEGKIESLSNVETLFIFCWNREYPADIVFDLSPEENGFFLAESEDFEGSSHENITLKVFRRAE